MMKLGRLALVLLGVAALQGCLVYTVADAAVSTVATAGKVAVKTTGAVVDAVIPDGDDD